MSPFNARDIEFREVHGRVRDTFPLVKPTPRSTTTLKTVISTSTSGHVSKPSVESVGSCSDSDSKSDRDISVTEIRLVF